MDGQQLRGAVLDLCDDRNSAAEAYKKRKIYECLDHAASIFCRETRYYKSSATLTTVEGQQDYTLPADFIDLYMKRSDRYFVRYYDGTDYSFPRLTPWPELFVANLTDRQSVPARVAIRDVETATVAVTGTATAPAGAKSSDGLAVLTDSAQTFLTTHRVWPRDGIHNETDGSSGYVIEVTGATSLKCALFNGSNDDWTIGDAYTIVPNAEKQLTLDAPALTAGHLIAVPFIAMPDPVYSDHASWRLPARICLGIAAGAAALLQLPEHSYQETQWMNGQFREEIFRTKQEIAQTVLKSGNGGRRGW